MGRLRASIACAAILGCLPAAAVAAPGNDKTYSVLERVPTAHGCLFARFTGMLHYHSVTPSPGNSRTYRGIQLVGPSILTWRRSTCSLTSGVYEPNYPGSFLKTAYHATTCIGIVNSNGFAKGPVAGCKGNVAAVFTMTTVVKGLRIGLSADNVDFADAIAGPRFCFTLGASVYSHQPGGDAVASFAPRVCIS